MEAQEYRFENHIVLELKGRVDEFNTAVLRDEIHTIINTGRSRIAIDLSKTEFLSAHCLHAIWQCQKRALRFGGNIVLFGMSGKVLETISFVNLSAVMPCLPDHAHVIAFYGGGGPGQPSPTSPLGSASGSRGLKAMISRFFQFGILVALVTWGGVPVSYAADLKSADLKSSKPTPPVANSEGATPPTPRGMTLEGLKELALRSGATAHLAALQQQERLQDRDIAKSLQLPTLLLTTGYLYQSNPNLLSQVANRELNQLRQRGAESEFSDLQTNTNFKIDQDVMVVSLGVVQTLYSGGLYDARLHLAESQIKEQDAKSRVDTRTTLERIEQLYWGILLTEKKVELLESKRNAAAAKLTAMQQSYSDKAIAKATLAESEIEDLQSEQSLLEARQEVIKLRETLNALLGRPLNETLDLAESAVTRLQTLHDPEAYLQIAENRHPELTYAASRIETARAYEETLAAGAVRSPKAFLLGAMDHTRGIGERNDLMNWTLGVAVTMPLYDGGRSFAESEKSRLLISQARLGYEEARRKLYLDIRECVSRLRTAALKLDIAEKGNTLALARTGAVKEAISQNQLPKYQFEATRSAEIESKIAVILAQAEYLQWASRLRALTMEDLQ